VSSAGDWERFKDAVGGRVQARRKALGLTQEDLAGLAEVDRKHISSIETGKAEPRLSTFVKIADSLQMPRPVLMEGFAWIPNEHGTGRLEQQDC
jgi:transcriptional regulator with XRE-family HTH domain